MACSERRVSYLKAVLHLSMGESTKATGWTLDRAMVFIDYKRGQLEQDPQGLHLQILVGLFRKAQSTILKL